VGVSQLVPVVCTHTAHTQSCRNNEFKTAPTPPTLHPSNHRFHVFNDLQNLGWVGVLPTCRDTAVLTPDLDLEVLYFVPKLRFSLHNGKVVISKRRLSICISETFAFFCKLEGQTDSYLVYNLHFKLLGKQGLTKPTCTFRKSLC
jgi:hypothetical protein